MRIDSNQEAQGAANSERAGSPPPASANPASASAASGLGSSALGSSNLGSSALGEDQAELSGFHLEVQGLIAQLSGLPETTPQKVSALREAVVTGSYQPSPDEVAGALFSNMVVKLAA
ncbi:MAG: flagellar biosynthesis anti-sigma factor FlgM [Candidatus Sulfotelmatobacter sp.]